MNFTPSFFFLFGFLFLVSSVKDVAAGGVAGSGFALDFGDSGKAEMSINDWAALPPEFTLEAWFKLPRESGAQPGIVQPLFSRSRNTVNQEADFVLFLKCGDRQHDGTVPPPQIYFLMGSGNNARPYGVLVESEPFPFDQWTHVSMMISDPIEMTKELKTVLVLDLETTFENKWTQVDDDHRQRLNDRPINVGFYQNEAKHYYRGQLDEIRIWNGDQSRNPFKRSSLRGKEPFLPMIYFNFDTERDGKLYSQFGAPAYLKPEENVVKVPSTLNLDLLEIALSTERYHMIELPGLVPKSGKVIPFYIHSIPEPEEGFLFTSPVPQAKINPKNFPFLLPSDLVFFQPANPQVREARFNYTVGRNTNPIGMTMWMMEGEESCEKCVLCELFTIRRYLHN